MFPILERNNSGGQGKQKGGRGGARMERCNLIFFEKTSQGLLGIQ